MPGSPQAEAPRLVLSSTAAPSQGWRFNFNFKIENSVPQSHQPHFKHSVATGGQCRYRTSALRVLLDNTIDNQCFVNTEFYGPPLQTPEMLDNTLCSFPLVETHVSLNSLNCPVPKQLFYHIIFQIGLTISPKRR